MLSHGEYNGSKVGVRVMHYLECAHPTLIPLMSAPIPRSSHEGPAILMAADWH
jgi:hypothetical protein